MREGRLPLSSRVNVLGERSRSDETQSKIKNLKSRIGLRFLQASTGFDLPILPHEPSGKGMGVSDEPSPLSTPFHKYDHVCCVDFRLWRGATREHPPKWGCDRGATKPEPKSDATLRAAVLFGPDFVAHSLQTHEGYARRSRLVWAKNPSPQTWLYL